MFLTRLLIRSLLLISVELFMTEGNSGTTETEGSHQHDHQHHHLLEGIQLPFHKFLQHFHHVDQHHNPNATEKSSSSSISSSQPQPATPEELPKLRFNGAGVRSVNFWGWDFKVYVAGFYHAAQHLIRDAEAVLTGVNHYPMQLDFTFLRNVNQNKVTEAWQTQLAHSVEYTYDGFEKDRDEFVHCFGPIETGGTESVVLLQDGRTLMVDQGVMKGVIYNKQFQRAFLSMWFGTKAVAPELKLGLLGGIAHYGLQHHQTQPLATVLESVGIDGRTENVEA